MGGVTRRVTCTNWLLWLSIEMPWLVLGGPIGSASAERVGVVAVCRSALVGTGWSNSCLVCTNRLRKHCSHLVGSSFLAVKAFSALNECLLAENAD